MYGLIVCGVIASVVGYYLLSRNDKANTAPAKQDTNKTVSKETTSSEHNYQDVDFAKKMILVNQQAMQVSGMGANKAMNKRIKDLASNINSVSESNSTAFIALLKKWNETHLNISDFPEMDGHDMYPTFPGMVKLSEIQQLRNLSGSEFDKALLTLLVLQHQTVFDMASSGADSQNQEVSQLTTEIITAHTEKIKEMIQLQKDLGF